MKFPDLKLPVWMSGKNTQALKRVAIAWWQQVEMWLKTPLDLGNALDAPIAIVDLLAYQRNVNRYRNEPEWLYRLRTHFAFLNAKDAGTGAGMKRIFERLEMPVFGIDERIEGYDWDMLRLRAGVDTYTKHRTALDIVLTEYRRTCRRWIIDVESDEIRSDELLTNAGVAVIDLGDDDIRIPLQATQYSLAAGYSEIDLTETSIPMRCDVAGSITGMAIIDLEELQWD